MPTKEMVARETALFIGKQQCVSVRCLARKFWKDLATAAKLSDEVLSLATKLTQREGELIQEEFEVKKHATFIKEDLQ